VGQTVAASFQTPTLFTIAQDLAQMQIDSNYAEADIGGIKVGQPTRFTVDAYPNRLFEGKVRQIRINPTTQSNVVTYDVVVDVNNEDLSLFPGMTAYVNIVVAQKKGVLLVPNAALRFKPPAPSRKPGAYVAGKDEKRKQNVGTVHAFENGRFLPISIAVGITDNKVTEVVSGDLKLGDKIVVEELVPTDSGQQSTFKMRMF
jgi:HlyD family secretion protein